MRRKGYKLLALLATGVCLMGALTGCGSLKQKYTADEAKALEVMKVGEETVTADELYLYAIQCCYMYGLDEKTAVESLSTYKSAILEQIQSAKAKYQVALTADIEINEEEEKEIDETVDRFYETYSEELFDAYGISRDAVRQLFVEQRYITKLQDKAMTDLTADYMKEAHEQFDDKRFIELYYVTFPISSTDENGAEVAFTDDQKAEQKKKAEEFRQKVIDGGSIEEMAAELGDTVVADTQRTFVGIYKEDLNNILETLENGEVSTIYEDESGYMVMQMKNKNDTEYKDFFIEAYANQEAQNAYTQMESVWVGSMPVEEDDFIGDTWEKMTLVDIARYMAKNNMSINATEE